MQRCLVAKLPRVCIPSYVNVLIEHFYCVWLTVEAKRLRQYVSIGREMIAHHKENHPFPTVVEISEEDSMLVRRLKRIILHMTKFKPMQRKDMQEVEAEMSGKIKSIPSCSSYNSSSLAL